MPTMMPIPMYHSGHSRPLNEYETKVLLGVFIILCVIWTISTIYLIIKYRNRKDGDDIGNSFIYFYLFGDYIVLHILNILMSFISVMLILIYLGSLLVPYL